MNEMTVYEGSGDIQVNRPPEVVLEEARRAAKVLTDVLKKKPKKVIMNGEQYLEFEDWQTVARFYGVTAKIKETEFLDYGVVKGFLAKAVAIRNDGMEISAAEAMCMNDEPKWSTRTKYEWVDGKRKKIGEEPVPLFQLRSMAQTRAAAKALRNVLAWVVVLAGYKPTVAEEMTGDEEPEKETIKEPQRKKESPAEQPDKPKVKDPDAPSTEAQHKAIFALMSKLDITDDLAKHEKATELAGIDGETITSMKALTKGQASMVIEALGKEIDGR